METCVTRIYTFSFPFTRSNLWRPDEAKRNPVAGSARAESQNLQVSVLKFEAMVRSRARSLTPASEGARKRWCTGVPNQQFIGRDESTKVSEECNDEQAPASLLDGVEGEGEGTEVTEKCDDEQAPASLLDVAVKGEGTDISVDTDCFSVDIQGSGDDAAFSQNTHYSPLFTPGMDSNDFSGDEDSDGEPKVLYAPPDPWNYGTNLGLTVTLDFSCADGELLHRDIKLKRDSDDDDSCDGAIDVECENGEQAAHFPRNGADREVADGE